MTKNKKLMELATRLSPFRHRRFEEMCTLAATGQLGGPQMCELNEHIAKCNSCRKFLQSVAQVSVRVMAVLAEDRVPAGDVVPPEGMRARFLARITAEEQNGKPAPRPQPVLIQKPALISPEARYENATRTENTVPSRVRWVPLRFLWRPAEVIVVCLIIGTAGFYAGKNIAERRSQPPAQAISSTGGLPHGSTSPDRADRVSQSEPQKPAMQSQLSILQSKLVVAEARQRELSDKLRETNDRFSTLTMQSEDEQRLLTQQEQQARGQVSLLQGEVEKLRWQLDESKARLTAQQRESEERKARLEETEFSRQRELDLRSAKSEIGELVAARNLHIVDVYDADSGGKRQRSFGRVFYIEGKALVFYAYELEDPRKLNANVVFHVWGEKAGLKETIHSLGILHNDDANHGRWAMTFDDSQVLAQINSVFVTAEVANKHYHEPHGKKVLYAYFGSQPNHP